MKWNTVKKLIRNRTPAMISVIPDMFVTGLESEAVIIEGGIVKITLLVPFLPTWTSELSTNYSQVIHKSKYAQIVDIEEFKEVIALINRP